MGYHTDFNGSIELDKPLTEEDRKWFEGFCRERHTNVESPSYYCDWRYDDGGKYYEPSITAESGKNYSSDSWLEYLIENFFKPKGYVLNGEIECEGEESGDLWKMVVKDNVLEVKQAKIIWD